MNDNRALAIWKWSAILLVLCNIGLIITLWFKPQHDNRPQPGGPRNFVIRELKFTDDQVKKYDELIKVHRSYMDPLNRDAMEYRRLLFNNLQREPNGLNADSLIQLIANNQKQIETVTYAHFKQVRAMCTDAQKTEFDRIITDVMKQMNGGHAPHHPGDRPGPPPERREGDDHHPDDGQEPPPGPPQDH
jgi:hypothetical protein